MTTPRVNTVTGPVSPDELGVTLMHEHIVFGYPGWYGDTTVRFDREEVVEEGVRVLGELRRLGVGTVVDATPNECGRDPLLDREISDKSGVHIVCATGFYTEGEGAPAYFRFRQLVGHPVDEIHELMLKEITEGIGDSGVRAGVIKLASGLRAITDYERMFFEAAARVQRETGVPIITHTEHGTMGPEQAELLIGLGADPKRIMIGHMSDNCDLSYQIATLSKGVYVAFDRMGLEAIPDTPDDRTRCACLIGLVGIGYADRLMISHDASVRWLGRPPEVAPQVAPLIANWEPTHLFRNIIPALERGGVTTEQIDTIVRDNPRRLFAGA